MKLTKIIQLTAPADNDALGLKKGDNYYVVTHAKGVVGLDDFVNSLIPDVATTEADGLMSSEDKSKLTSIHVEPFNGLEFISPNGSLFNVSISDEGKVEVEKKENNNDNN